MSEGEGPGRDASPGLLEYLEDIIGTDSLVPQIEEEGKKCAWPPPSGFVAAARALWGRGAPPPSSAVRALTRPSLPPTHATRTLPSETTKHRLEELNERRAAMISKLKSVEKEVEGLAAKKEVAEAYLSKQVERLNSQITGNRLRLLKAEVRLQLAGAALGGCGAAAV